MQHSALKLYSSTMSCTGVVHVYWVFTKKSWLCSLYRYLQQNLLTRLENLEGLTELDTLNVANNSITRLENIGKTHHDLSPVALKYCRTCEV